NFAPDMVAGHSLGEFSALVASGAVDFEDGLKLVAKRAGAMQQACTMQQGTMAAIIGMEDAKVEEICASTEGIVIPANYNCDGQLVISGELSAVQAACEAMKAAGARKAVILQVGGAFHSPLMEPAREALAEAIEKTIFKRPICPVYQNVDAKPHIEPNEIKENLLKQLSAPVLWKESVRQMVADGATQFCELGPGKVLSNLIKKIAPQAGLI
ncbi:MAG: ACP S-malonyltransferase, partial [Bacteroidales bacterium]|nr:ACP S-malonyltransferase [Bacteroidales bacterium]